MDINQFTIARGARCLALFVVVATFFFAWICCVGYWYHLASLVGPFDKIAVAVPVTSWLLLS